MQQDTLGAATVEARHVKWEVMHVRMDELARKRNASGPAAGNLKQTLAVVESDYSPRQTDAARQRANIVTEAAANIEQMLSLTHRQQAVTELSPQICGLPTLALVQVPDEALRVRCLVYRGEVTTVAAPGLPVQFIVCFHRRGLLVLETLGVPPGRERFLCMERICGRRP
jgi:hypothetical protein